jgi:hypothetical protein
MKANHSDRIYPVTRLVAAIVVPVLVLAFAILYFMPGQSGERFAWAIQPDLMAMFMGAGYIGGAYLFLRVALGGRWHRVAPGFLPVTAFTISMLLATILHWERFELGHFPFILWLILYVVTPFLIPFLWWWNRHEDPGTPEPGDKVVPAAARYGLMAAGAIIGLFALLGILAPTTLIDLWVWPLTPLLARVLGGWFALLAVGGLTIGRETRWSAWQIGLTSIFVWHLLVLIAAVVRAGDFKSSVVNWYTILLVLGLVGMAVLAVAMTLRRR